MDEDLIKFLRKCKIFAPIEGGDDIFAALLVEFKRLHFKKGEYLFHQGDTADHIYIVASGRFAASFTSGTANPKIMGYIQAGEAVGEIGALSNEPRSLDMIALETSMVLQLPSETFKKLCRQYPAILFETVSPLVNRSRETIRALSNADKKKHIAIVPANREVKIEQFEKSLQETLSHYKKVILLSETEIQSDKEGKQVNVDHIIADAEASNHVILYLLKAHDTPLAKACASKLSKLYIIAQGDSRPNLSAYVQEILHNSKQLLELRRELILLYENKFNPLFTSAWLHEEHFYLHHHIQVHVKSDFQRLVRFMRGKAVGVVLSGGGARCWAHLGALRALIEANIPIDAIGGTSGGAIIASLYARHKDLISMEEDFAGITDKISSVVSLKNFCWPAISLFNCYDATLQVQTLYKDTLIENLAIPYFCVTCNLALYKEVAHRSGLLWEKIRASTAVPGIVPPMVINGDLHIDGGVVNNLPVNVMRELLGPEGTIIAIELITKQLDSKKYNFPPTLSFKEAFLSKFRLGYRNYKFPPFLDTFIKSLLVGSSVKQEENAMLADVLISPHAGKYNMLKIKQRQKEELVRIGYKATKHKILGWDRKK